MSDKKTVLVVDDEMQMLLAMEAVLERLGVEIKRANNGEEALEIIAQSTIDIIVSDMNMPKVTGLELLQRVNQLTPEREKKIPVILITAYGTIQHAVDAMKMGAYDFITKPFSADDLEKVITRIINPPVIKRNSSHFNSKTDTDRRFNNTIITNDPKFKQVIDTAITIAPSQASVLIEGESGTGKEVLSKLIHQASRRKDGPFVAVNCAALPGNLLESELFGHEKGSFTGAVGTKIGKFELANGGTILLDEISEMEPILQAKLLRVLQEREVDRVGGSKPVQVDVRVIATTNRNIRKSVRTGSFREDLYYRLNVIPLYVPPLRERKGDIKLLTEHYLRLLSAGKSKLLTTETIEKLENYSWKGNVRELQNACERAFLLAQDRELKADDFLLGTFDHDQFEQINTLHIAQDSELQLKPGLSVAEAEKRLIFETLRSTVNNKTKAAELLGISIRTLRNKLNEYGVSEQGD
jgi:DNA-binding NtrC family response regulator